MYKKLVYLISFVLALGLAEGQAWGVYRAAYWAENYTTHWSDRAITIEIRDYFAAAGYEILDADQLKTWMYARIADKRASVVVFCPDLAPDTVVETNTPNCTLRRYLDAGGKIVFHGDIPFYNQGNRGGGETNWAISGSTGILGFNAASAGWDGGSTVQITEAGVKWGLTKTWASIRPTAANVTDNLTILATDNLGNAAAWVKHYVPGDTSAGFVRLFDRNDSPGDQPNLEDMQRVAEYGLVDTRLAIAPNPADEEIDVPRDVALSWTPGEFADTHDVYFGTFFADVNNASRTNPQGVLASQGQTTNTYDPVGLLEFGQTYYWRVDEVNAPPTSNIVFKGDVWQFTVEPVAYPIAGSNITATASSQAANRGPENTINGSGLDESGLLHGKDADDNMWLSVAAGPQPTWIEYEFDKAHKLHEMWVWNHNEGLEPVLGFGFKDVIIEYSANGIDYTTLGTTHRFARAPGTNGYAHNTTVDFGGVIAKYVRLTANNNWGGILNQYGLSEVRFFYIPVYAREPDPASGATDTDVDAVLSWRAGREAAKHDVYFSDSNYAVIDGTAPVTTVSQAIYGPLSLDLGKTYYWRVDEVNEAQTPALWHGDLWNFTTQEYYVVDDFESYNDLDTTDPASNRIFNTWLDGYGTTTNGSIVGYENPPFAERTIIHGGKQSMPLAYNNTGGAAYSEAERTFAAPQNWTEHGFKTLSLWFSGAANNVAGQMYVKVNGSKVTYDGDASNLTRGGWQAWNINLASVGVNLQNVTKLAVGIDGNGAKGTLYFDDIRLYPYDRQFITPTEPPLGGLIGHWKFDGDAQDSSGKGNHGTLGGNPTFVAGKVGTNALNLDGSDYVAIDGVVNDITSTNITLSVWVKTTQSSEGNVFAANDSASGYALLFGVQGGNPYRWDGADAQYPPAVNDNQWHHLAYVRSGSTGYIYVDGVQRVSYSTSFSLSSVTRWSIGQEWDDSSPSDFYNGAVDDARFYNRSLLQEEIAWLAGWTKPFDKPF